MAGMQTEPCGANAADDAKRQEPRFGRLPSLIIAVTVIGMLIGVAAGLLTLMLYVVEHAFLGYVEGDGQPGPFDVPAWRRAISVFVGLSIAAFAWWLLRTRTARVPSVKKAVRSLRAWGCPRGSTITLISCPADSSSGSPSPGHWPCRPISSALMSRPPRWTRS